MGRARTITADAVFVAICTLREANGFTPTLRELAEAVGLASAHNLYPYLDELESSGRITRVRGVARTIQVVDGAADSGSRSGREE